MCVAICVLQYVLVNVCVYFPGCDVINFESNLVFLIKSFLYMTEKSKQKFKYLENKKSFQDEIKSIFHHFKGISIVKNCLRPESAALIVKLLTLMVLVSLPLKTKQH